MLTMCDRDMWECNHKNISSGFVRNPYIGDWMEDKLTSIKIEPYNHWAGGANLYEGEYCDNKFATFWRWDQDGEAYTAWDMEQQGMPQTAASSIQVPGGFVVDLYDIDGLRGSKKTIIGFTDTDGKVPCINLQDFSNRVASLEIREIGQGGAIGYWDGITSTETTTFNFTVGVV